MRVVTVPNWSFGRERTLFRAVQDLLEAAPVQVHDCSADDDHNRTVTAFSGDIPDVEATLQVLARRILPAINLTSHMGVHPRIGGLDVCPFVPLAEPVTPAEQGELEALVDRFACFMAEEFQVPVFLYERSERGRHEGTLPDLRRGGFGWLLERELSPDFGPSRAHPLLGASVMGWRDFLHAFNVNLKTTELKVARQIAREIRALRQEGNLAFIGVRALGLSLASRKLTQVSLNLTMPDLTPVDTIYDHIRRRALELGVAVAGHEFIGVVRADLDRQSSLKADPRQLVEVERRVSA